MAPKRTSNYRFRNRDKNKEKEATRRYRQAHPERVKQQSVEQKLKQNYGITLAEYNTLFEKQGGLCAICKLPERSTLKGNLLKLSVDHDHVTLKIRQLLCRKCNSAIGLFDDDVLKMQSAVDYINRHRRGD